jgi:hypothetical protein
MAMPAVERVVASAAGPQKKLSSGKNGVSINSTFAATPADGANAV